MTETNIIYGKNAVFETIKKSQRNVNKIIISKGLFKDNKIDEIINFAKLNNITFQFLPKEYFSKYKDYNHQGIIAFTSPVEYVELEDFFNKPPKNDFKRIIALDGVEDPHNLGAIIRTAVCAGYDAVLIPQRRSALLNEIVQKTSAGAINYIDVIKVNSLPNTIDRLKKSNFWVIAAEASGNDNYFQIDFTSMNFVIVVGSEGAGVSKTILNNSDFFVKIPMFNEFNSLNVSNAAAVLIYESIRQIMSKNKT